VEFIYIIIEYFLQFPVYIDENFDNTENGGTHGGYTNHQAVLVA